MDKRDIEDLELVSKSSNSIVQLIVAIIGVFITIFGVIMFNRYLLMQFPIGVRMILMILSQWIIMLVPATLIMVNKDKLSDFGMKTENISHQILIGVIFALLMSLILTIVPILLGFKEMVGSTSYSKPWQFAYDFVYSIIGVALAEEFVFRGYIFHKLLEVKDSRWFAIIVSSILFGLFHIFNGNLMQVIGTSFIGFLFCIFREKIRNCTLLSLVIAHGLYDGMIELWVALL
ncbi:type II CAAX endopeptidase family protein [Tissierella sp.]|uniref:CPBP family intramembrane glutamic endopeptidase n=1 Tax=Tissierella sp. TaxID=41274 RepID=UPI002855BD13|nr:type II CAAX endopeptidase family protein [Tissierella sp.]MDR7857895.1 type II CAAX endopeptidase family protein [Tissierella sp.]